MLRPGSTYHPSIVNTILGPITIGPSSSHFAGPVRLGRLVRGIINATPAHARIVFNAGGAFAATYRGHRTDCALVAGLLDRDTDDPEAALALEQARRLGIDVSFGVEPLGDSHPNAVRFTVTAADGQITEVTGVSDGGGAVRISQVNGQRTDMDGQGHALLITLTSHEHAARVSREVEQAIIRSHDDDLLVLGMPKPPTDRQLSALSAHEAVREVRYLKPVFFPARPGSSAVPLFESADELLRLADESGTSLSALALRYEVNRLGWEAEEIRSHIGRMTEVMRASRDRGLTEELPLSGGIVNQGGRRLLQAMTLGRTVCSGTLPRAAAYAMAVNEVSDSLGLIVAAPTAGACGVIPGAVFAAAEELNCDHHSTLRDALLAAAAVGVVFARRATFLAELCGCQVESGAAAAMASAAVVEMAGGTARQAMDAASISMQNILGMECDPVAGLMEVPCINRNALGAVNALLSADIVLAGVNSVIPFDEVVDAAYETGRFRPVQCGGCAGLAATPTSQAIRRGLDRRRENADDNP